MVVNIGVVGAGLTGLSTAVNIQKLIRDINITLIADSFGQQTTTPVTRGIFLPIKTARNLRQLDLDVVSAWFLDGWNHHFSFAKCNNIEENNGHSLTTGYYLWNEPNKSPITEEAVFNYRSLTLDELTELDFHQYSNGCSFTTALVDIEVYLRWLMKEFRSRGGSVVYKTVDCLQKFYGEYDIVVNCTGMRAHEQISDPGLISIKGQVVRMIGFDTSNFIVAENDVFIMPSGPNQVDVGFAWTTHVYPTGVVRKHIKQLLARARRFCPTLLDCGVVAAWDERKPYRHCPLVKTEMLNCNGAFLPIVHNVALGTETLALAWGTGLDAARLVLQLTRKIQPFAPIRRPPFNPAF